MQGCEDVGKINKPTGKSPYPAPEVRNENNTKRSSFLFFSFWLYLRTSFKDARTRAGWRAARAREGAAAQLR